MWFFCKSGYFSAVQHFEKPGVIHVRARFSGDLERLCRKHGVEPKVLETPNNDYRYRMDFDRGDWAKIVMEESLSIDYTNFKNAVHDGTPRDSAYMNCWAALNRAQK